MMDDGQRTSEDSRFVSRAVESAIRIGVIVVLVVLSFRIMRPFLDPVLWGVILAVAIAPVYRGLDS